MEFLPLFGILACCLLWLRGLKSLWARALLLAGLAVQAPIVLPGITQDQSLSNLGIYQSEAAAFAARVASLIERGDHDAAKRQLLYFSSRQNWDTATSSKALQRLYKQMESEGGTPALRSASSPQLHAAQ